MTVFDVFQEQPYTYLEISSGGVLGNTITKETSLMGIFKERDNQETMQNIETDLSNATLHAHPEDFSDYSVLVGNGVRVNGVDYEILSMTVGTNFDTGADEHLTFTLQRASYSE